MAKEQGLSTMFKVVTYVLVFEVIVLLRLLLLGVEFEGGMQGHTVLEVAAAMVALLSGVMVLVRYFSSKHNTLLMIVAALLGSGGLDVTRVVMTSPLGSAMMVLPQEHFVWSWFGSRLYLGVMLLLAGGALMWEKARGERGKLEEAWVFITGVLLLGTVVVVGLWGGLPEASVSGEVLSHPQGLVTGGVFLLGAVWLLALGNWKEHFTDHWLILSLITAGLSEALFVSTATSFFDGVFVVGQLLKVTGYGFVLMGMLISTYNLFVRLSLAKTIEVEREKERLAALVAAQTLELKRREKDLEDQQTALLNVLEDVSEEKTIGETRSQSILETIGEGIVITDDEGKVEYVNPAFVNMFGFTIGDLRGKVFEETMVGYDLHEKRLGAEQLSNTAAVTAKHTDSRFLIEDKKGERVAVAINAAAMYLENEFKGVVRVIHNYSEDLALQRQKDEFFSIASHELRTPLTVIAGNVDTVLEGYGKSKLSKDDKMLMNDTQEATERLIKMVNDFLNVSRMDQGQLQADLKEVEVCGMVDDVVEKMRGLVEDKGLYLKHKCDLKKVKVLVDEDKLKEVMINLVGNSVKFTKEGGISIDHELFGEWVKLVVSDTGMGIAKEKQALLFHRFQQAMGRTLAREAGGTGLGLYISREFMRLMGGNLRLVKSEEGKGSVFEIAMVKVQSKTAKK